MLPFSTHLLFFTILPLDSIKVSCNLLRNTKNCAMSSLDFSSLLPAEQEALLNGPALQPPADVVPQFDNPPNKNDMAHAVYGLCFAIGSLFVFARVYGTWFCLKKAHISDCKYCRLLTLCYYSLTWLHIDIMLVAYVRLASFLIDIDNVLMFGYSAFIYLSWPSFFVRFRLGISCINGTFDLEMFHTCFG